MKKNDTLGVPNMYFRLVKRTIYKDVAISYDSKRDEPQ